MSGLLDRFAKDRRGTTFEGIALSVSIIAVAFVASADMLDYVVKKHGGEPAAVETAARTATPPNLKDLDDTPTATLPKLISRSVLDPCTGQAK